MEYKFKPFIAVDMSIYFTDGAEEVIVYTFDRDDIAETVSSLLNDAYNGAYQDGLSASLNERYKELVDNNISLSIQNSKLKSLLKIDENK